MKLLHIADMHLGSAMKTHLSPEQAKERKKELIRVLQQYIDMADSEAAEGVLVAGDIFDESQVPTALVDAVRSIIHTYDHMQFYLLRGNHDSKSSLVRLADGLDNVHLFDEDWTYYPLNDEGSVVLAGAEPPSGDYSELSEPDLDVNAVNIVMLHGQDITGTRAFAEYDIPLAALAQKGIDYLALGHIHAHREGKLDTRGIYVYTGCMAGRGFDELDEHGAVMIDIDEQTGVIQHSFIPSPERRCFRSIDIDITAAESVADAESIIEAELNKLDRDNMYRAVLTGAPAFTISDIGVFDRAFSDGGIYHIHFKNMTQNSEDYHFCDGEISLRSEFVKCVMEDEELSDKEKKAIIRMGLQAIRQEEITFENNED